MSREADHLYEKSVVQNLIQYWEATIGAHYRAIREAEEYISLLKQEYEGFEKKHEVNK